MTALAYEDFEEPASGSETPSPEYLRGYEAGLAEGRHGAESEQAQLSDRLVAAIEDLRFGKAEARQALRVQVGEVLSALVEALLPMPGEAAFVDLLVGRLSAHVEEAVDGPLCISGRAADIELLEGAIGQHDSATSIECRVDETLGPQQFIVDIAARQVMLDYGWIRAEVADLLETLKDAAPDQTRKEAANDC